MGSRREKVSDSGFEFALSSFVRPAPTLVAAGAAWTALVITAPLLEWPALYSAAHLVCHQLPQRTFQLADGPMAVCARCLGLYSGAVIAGTAAVGFRWGDSASAPGRSWRPGVLLALAAVPTILALGAEWVLRWPVTNAVRFGAALPLGGAAAWVVARALEVDWRT